MTAALSAAMAELLGVTDGASAAALANPMLSECLERMESAYYTFEPRPDQPERYDEQSAFVNSKTRGVKFLIGGNGAGTTSCALNAVAKFVLRDQEAPRKDTPFWIISGTFEQCMATCWKEKLHGHGHIPDSEVDWERVVWYSSKDGWPYRVPLKPWGNSKTNWVLEFKSYEQGRSPLQARSIGGFLFSEQFPFVLLEEVLRGCREYNFPGSKMVEYTPVDPSLSAELDEMMDDDKLPPGWEIYRANTECAMEAGHVDEAWFNEFFGMLSDDMREVRMIGARAIYQGAVYPGFNPAVHCVGDDVIDFPPNVFYRRSIDWGSGPENAFAAHWCYRNGLGEYFFFDEYYSTDQTKTVMDHLCEIQDRMRWPVNNQHYGTTYADPSASSEIRMAQRMSQYAPGYENMDISLAGNDVNAGIEHFKYMLQTNPGTGRPRVFIHKKRCPYLVRQMKTYRWIKGNPRGLNPKDGKPKVLKKDDHAVDSARYLLFSEAHFKNLSFGSTHRSLGKTESKRFHGVHNVRNGRQ